MFFLLSYLSNCLFFVAYFLMIFRLFLLRCISCFGSGSITSSYGSVSGSCQKFRILTDPDPQQWSARHKKIPVAHLEFLVPASLASSSLAMPRSLLVFLVMQQNRTRIDCSAFWEEIHRWKITTGTGTSMERKCETIRIPVRVYPY
jgi:hypothetical protein